MNLNIKNEAHESFETYLSLNTTQDKRFIGVFEKLDNGLYTVKDLRMSDFSRIEQYKVVDENGNESEPKGTIDFTFHSDNSFSPTPNFYYYFSWVYTDSNPLNLCEIQIDLSKPIERLTPKDIITLLYNYQMNLGHGAAKTTDQILDTLKKQLTASGEEVFVYELLQNANDYPHKKGEEVNVEIRLTDNYLLFRHTGAEFSPKNIAALCSANDKDKTDNPDAIGYKGIGFKTVFNNNNYVYLKTGGFSFTYDESIKKKKGHIPWQITPIWKEIKDADTEYGNVFVNDDNYRVQFALRPIKHAKLREGDDSYLSILKKLFVDETKILFIPNLGSVKVFLDDKNVPTYDCSRRSEKWCLSQIFENDVDPKITEQINQELSDDEDNETSRIPAKYLNFRKTGVSFACGVNGRKLIPQKEAIMYCYLPAENANWGFEFYMNTDMIPNGPRDDIERGISLNFYLAENAGKMFYRWIYSLIESGLYDYSTIYALIPNFEKCLNRRPVNKGFVERFQIGFESCLELPIVPTNDGRIVPIKQVIFDNTYITNSGILTDEQFYSFSEMDGFLPHFSLRNNESFKQFIVYYLKKLSKFNIFEFQDLKDCCKESDEMKSWLLDSNHNGDFLSFLINCTGSSKIKDFSKLPIFIDNNNHLKSSNDIYFSGDNIKQALQYLDSFIDFFPHLSSATLQYFENQKDSIWSDIWPTLGFKSFKAGDFVGGIMFNQDNKAKSLDKLSELSVSVKFYNYLALNAHDNYGDLEFIDLPFIDSEGNVISSFAKKLIFFAEDNANGTKLLKEKWFDESWAYFLNEAYSNSKDEERLWRFFIDHNLVKIFESKIIATEILSDSKRYEYIREKTSGDLEASCSFVHYVFKNKHHLYDDTNFRNVPLCVKNLDGVVSFEICQDISAFTSINNKPIDYSWLDNSWMSVLCSKYFDNIPHSDLESFTRFLVSKFGLKQYNEKNFYYCVARKNRILISKKMMSNQTINKDFFTYLASILPTEFGRQENFSSSYPELPIIDCNGAIRLFNKDIKFIYNSDLSEIQSMSWLPDNAILMTGKFYDSSKIKMLLKGLGFREYSSSGFGQFFEEFLLDKVQLNTIEQTFEFHSFMQSKFSSLNDNQKAKIKTLPVFLYSPNGARLINKCTGFYIQNPNLDVRKEIEDGYLPELNVIDDSLTKTTEMIQYWKSLGNTSFSLFECIKWIKSKESFFKENICSNLQNNLHFWRWLRSVNHGGISSNVSELLSFPTIQFSHRDTTQKESDTSLVLSSEGVYMPNAFHKGIETFANKYGPKHYISDKYVENLEDEAERNEWHQLFKAIGIKDDVKDVIRQIVENDLECLCDENIPALLTEQFSEEISDEWDTLKDKLINLQVKIKNENRFVKITEAIIVDTHDYATEPMPFVKLPMEISPIYMQNADVRSLIKKIAQAGKSVFITDRAAWTRAKVKAYIDIQSKLTDGITDMHLQFIENFAQIYKRNYPNWGFEKEAESILLYDKDGRQALPTALTLGKIYNPFCDFEGNGIQSKKYISDAYSQISNQEDILELFHEVFHVRMKFEEQDILLLSQPQFCSYFWNKYIQRPEPQEEFISWIKKGTLNNKLCIPNRKGLVCKSEDLYANNIRSYVEKKIPDWEDKLPITFKIAGKIFEILNEMHFKRLLNCEDCFNNLLNSHIDDDSSRSIVLGWLASTYKESDKALVQRYRSNAKALWRNGKKEQAHVAELYSLSDKNNKKITAFRSDEHIMDLERIKPSISCDNLAKALSIIGIPIIDDNDLEPVLSNQKLESDYVNPQIRLRLLALIGSRAGSSWNTIYFKMKNDLSLCKFFLCSSITYKYKELVSSEEKFFSQGNSFYYVSSWQGKQVFTSFVDELMCILKLDYDISSIRNILDRDEYDENRLVNFLDEHCSDLYEDAVFIRELESANTSIINKLNIRNDNVIEEEQEEDEEIESVSEDNKESPSYNPYNNEHQNSSISTSESDNIDSDNNNYQCNQKNIQTGSTNEINKENHNNQSEQPSHKDKSYNGSEQGNNSIVKSNTSENSIKPSSENSSKSHNKESDFSRNYSKDEDNSDEDEPIDDNENSEAENVNKETGLDYMQSSDKTNHQYNSELSTVGKDDEEDGDVSNYDYDEEDDELVDYEEEEYSDDSFDSPAYNGGYSQSRSSSTYSHRKPNQQRPHYDPLDEIAAAKEKLSFDLQEAEASEAEIAHNEQLFNGGLSKSEMMDQNTLVKTRMFNSFAEKGLELDMSEVDFIRRAGSHSEYDVKTKSGKYIHIVSAYSGIVYLSPTFWNRVQNQNCVVCIVLSHRAKNFLYINNKEELSKIIGGDDLFVKVTGHNKIGIVNQLFGKTLHGAIRKVYTMIRVKNGTQIDFLYKPKSNELGQDEINDNSDL